ncbi:hypothetical protein ACNOIU_08265 [Exiguobacterium mexicanum]|uniref:Uncharacterized protein n=1 Tax=Exiguobacterium mexicanum TaxID=340146 RepID=A0ABT7MLU3_9BACL|nr:MULTISPECIES: hypothetical protein [Exiguobacterium]MDL5376096.1 hypothetical protein [Exiguobacterium mexicanum]
MNVKDLLRRYSIDEPIIYAKNLHGQWIKLEQLPPYTILEVEATDEAIEALAIDAYVALTVCREKSSLEDARPYAVRLHIKGK